MRILSILVLLGVPLSPLWACTFEKEVAAGAADLLALKPQVRSSCEKDGDDRGKRCHNGDQYWDPDGVALFILFLPFGSRQAERTPRAFSLHYSTTI
jgi:hypothetical protein